MQEVDKKTKKLSKKDVIKAFWRWTFFSHSNYNYERLQSTAMVHCLAPIIKKLYRDDESEFKAAIKRHMEFFNTEPNFGGVIHGMVIAMEEQRANGEAISDEMINGLKTGLMGPFAGIGDTLVQGTLVPILLSFGISLGSEGNLLGPISYSVLIMGITISLAYYMWMQGYKLGREGIQKILAGNLLKKVMTMATTMGAIVLGALSANFVQLTTYVNLKMGASGLSIQKDVLDKLLLNLLPLIITLLSLKLLNKKFKATTVLAILIAIGAVGGILGIW
ncbi:PTS system mannose/fructose/sorbose family transporter subunit IID [Clostridium sp.]|nr:PTS system mannose/fructose/sorbose family transporter subunit IID [Clostridium sp.]MCI1714332.1 PTS system mannose/fructose/sorbose family transporter subunit IID [Clostridium sp.]MCI1798594.1 PTS system mannose/fructose/sorbose family transporter subunit IID [Clostridium sp.]